MNLWLVFNFYDFLWTNTFNEFLKYLLIFFKKPFLLKICIILTNLKQLIINLNFNSMKKVLLSFLVLMLSMSFVLKAQLLSGSQGQAVAAKTGIISDKGNMLWDQNWATTYNGSGVYSTFFGGNALTHQRTVTADDFIVPAGKQWATDTINVSFFNLKAIASDYHIFIYGESAGKPNIADVKFHDFFTVGGIAVGFWYDVKFPVSVTLPAGTYWISFVGTHPTGTVTNPGVFPGADFSEATFWLKRDTVQPACMGVSPMLTADSAGIVTASYPCFFSWFYYNVNKQYSNVRFKIKGTESTGISKNSLSLDNGIISAYPVPANNTITFRTAGNEGNVIEIYNTLGEKINTINLNGKNIVDVDITSYSNGMYFYELKSKNAVLGTGKFVKE